MITFCGGQNATKMSPYGNPRPRSQRLGGKTQQQTRYGYPATGRQGNVLHRFSVVAAIWANPFCNMYLSIAARQAAAMHMHQTFKKQGIRTNRLTTMTDNGTRNISQAVDATVSCGWPVGCLGELVVKQSVKQSHRRNTEAFEVV